MDKRQLVNQNDVISVSDTDKILVNHKTFRIEEFLQAIFAKWFNNDLGKRWLFDGVDCEILTPGKQWRKGKIKITLEFLPDEPESPLEMEREEISRLQQR